MDGSLTYGQICRVIKGVNSEIRQDRKESVGRQDKKESPGRRGAVSTKQVRTMDQRSAAVMRYALLSRVHVLCACDHEHTRAYAYARLFARVRPHMRTAVSPHANAPPTSLDACANAHLPTNTLVCSREVGGHVERGGGGRRSH